MDATARSGERGSTLEFSAPGKEGRVGAASLARRRLSGGTVVGGAAAPLEVLAYGCLKGSCVSLFPFNSCIVIVRMIGRMRLLARAGH